MIKCKPRNLICKVIPEGFTLEFDDIIQGENELLFRKVLESKTIPRENMETVRKSNCDDNWRPYTTTEIKKIKCTDKEQLIAIINTVIEFVKEDGKNYEYSLLFNNCLAYCPDDCDEDAYEPYKEELQRLIELSNAINLDDDNLLTLVAKGACWISQMNSNQINDEQRSHLKYIILQMNNLFHSKNEMENTHILKRDYK